MSFFERACRLVVPVATPIVIFFRSAIVVARCGRRGLRRSRRPASSCSTARRSRRPSCGRRVMRELLDVEVEVLGSRCDRLVERGAHPHDVVLREAELLGDGIGDGRLEALAGLGLVVDDPRGVRGLAGRDRELACRQGLQSAARRARCSSSTGSSCRRRGRRRRLRRRPRRAHGRCGREQQTQGYLSVRSRATNHSMVEENRVPLSSRYGLCSSRSVKSSKLNPGETTQLTSVSPSDGSVRCQTPQERAPGRDARGLRPGPSVTIAPSTGEAPSPPSWSASGVRPVPEPDLVGGDDVPGGCLPRRQQEVDQRRGGSFAAIGGDRRSAVQVLRYQPPSGCGSSPSSTARADGTTHSMQLARRPCVARPGSVMTAPLRRRADRSRTVADQRVASVEDGRDGATRRRPRRVRPGHRRPGSPRHRRTRGRPRRRRRGARCDRVPTSSPIACAPPSVAADRRRECRSERP